MRFRLLVPVAIIFSLLLVAFLPSVAVASTPTLSPPSGTLPSETYYYGVTHYTVTDSDWRAFFTSVYDNSSYVSYNWGNNTTQYLILFGLSYKGMNPYGLQILVALSSIGFPTLKNMTIAFNKTKNMASQVSGYSNIQALNAGAYPGFTWSVVKVKPQSTVLLEVTIIGIIMAATFVLYFVFNRKR